jgi:hypothetical protein
MVAGSGTAPRNPFSGHFVNNATGRRTKSKSKVKKVLRRKILGIPG